MSAAGRIGRAVEGVRAHLSRSLAVMVAAWCGTAALGLLVLAPALAGADGWSAGSPGPLVIVRADRGGRPGRDLVLAAA